MKRRAFTLVELLVTITIIGILASLVLGALQSAREMAREAATKATIVKLHNIIMQRYEGYLNRRIGFDTTGMTAAQIDAANQAARANPKVAARYRLDAIRDTMRMEMPDARSDVVNSPIAFSWGKVPEPALHRIYAAKPPTANMDAAKCLYLVVSMGSPESMEQFSQAELGTVDGEPVFVDGWGKPIMWLRWAPGCSSCTDPDFVAATGIHWTGTSTIQSGVALPYSRLKPDGTPVMNTDGTYVMVSGDHDPFDTRSVDAVAFRIIPLIYSSTGRTKADGTPQYGIDLDAGYTFAGNPYGSTKLGQPIAGEGAEGNITNHAIE